MTTTITKPRTVTSRLLAKIDPKAKAKVVRWSAEPEVFRAKTTRHTITREADVFDEVTEQAIWFGDGFAVIVEFRCLDSFRQWVNCHGMAPGGRTYEIQHLSTANVGFDRVLVAVRA
jgi:hypothetical protein